MRFRAFCAAALLLPGLACAGRPLNTEDASTLDDGACQVESWVNRSRGDASDFSFVPACALLGVEWQAGGVRTREAGTSATTAMFVQGKHAFRSVDDGAWGVGIVAGLTRFPRREARNDWGDPYLIVPVSFGLGEDKDTRALLHLNVGTARLRDEARNVTLWGVALEKPVTPRLTLLGEAFGENAADPFLRAGGRYTLFDRFDVDLTWVTRAGGAREDRFWSLGFHWETDALP
jgi:hypothetical protein